MVHRLAIPVLMLLSFLLLNTQCASTGEHDSMSWRAKMNLLSVSMGNLLPLASDPNKFNDPANNATIKKELKQIYKLASQIQTEKKVPDGDPVLKFSSKKFAGDMKSAYQQFSLGNKQQALFTINHMSNYCVSCHSRSDHGRSDVEYGWNIKLDQFSNNEKAQYYFATRQYNQGLNTFTKTFNNLVKNDKKNLESGLLKALAISVRVKQNYKLSEQIVNKVLKSKSPKYLKKYAKHWKKALKTWSKETEQQKMSRKAKYLQAKKLILKAITYKKPEYAYIEYLRASGYLHDVLMSDKKDYINGESLYLAGVAARPLRNINLWTLHESYFEACIKDWPQSRLAEKCYGELEKAWLSEGYLVDGEAPQPVKEKLANLKDLATKIHEEDEVNKIPQNNLRQ